MGTIPSQVWRLTRLISLGLYQNKFRGSIASQIGLLSHLQYFWAHSNNFGGTVPTQIGKMTALVQFHCPENNFEGTIPNQIQRLSNLESSSWQSNRFSGTVPQQIVSLPRLTHFFVSNNQLEGVFPTFQRSLAVCEAFSNDTMEQNCFSRCSNCTCGPPCVKATMSDIPSIVHPTATTLTGTTFWTSTSLLSFPGVATSASSVYSAMSTNTSGGNGVNPVLVGGVVAAVIALIVLLPTAVFFVCRRRAAVQKTPAKAELARDHPVLAAANQHGSISACDGYGSIESNYATSVVDLTTRGDTQHYGTLTASEVGDS